jgi:hypothetical protein
MSKEIKARSKAHTRYYLKNETMVVGTTTVTGLEGGDKTWFLCVWANGLGLDGYDYKKYMDNVSNLGTLVHYLCLDCRLGGEKPILDNYTPNEVKESKTSVVKFEKWLDNQKNFKPILIEKPLVSEKYGFGGTIDLYCELNGEKVLIDLKTSNACREGHKVQSCAYEQLLLENGYQVDDVKILRVGRKRSEGFEILDIVQRDLRWQKFKHLLEIYKLNRELKKGA